MSKTMFLVSVSLAVLSGLLVGLESGSSSYGFAVAGGLLSIIFSVDKEK